MAQGPGAARQTARRCTQRWGPSEGFGCTGLRPERRRRTKVAPCGCPPPSSLPTHLARTITCRAAGRRPNERRGAWSAEVQVRTRAIILPEPSTRTLRCHPQSDKRFGAMKAAHPLRVGSKASHARCAATGPKASGFCRWRLIAGATQSAAKAASVLHWIVHERHVWTPTHQPTRWLPPVRCNGTTPVGALLTYLFRTPNRRRRSMGQPHHFSSGAAVQQGHLTQARQCTMPAASMVGPQLAQRSARWATRQQSPRPASVAFLAARQAAQGLHSMHQEQRGCAVADKKRQAVGHWC